MYVYRMYILRVVYPHNGVASFGKCTGSGKISCQIIFFKAAWRKLRQHCGKTYPSRCCKLPWDKNKSADQPRTSTTEENCQHLVNDTEQHRMKSTRRFAKQINRSNFTSCGVFSKKNVRKAMHSYKVRGKHLLRDCSHSCQYGKSHGFRIYR